MIRGDVSVAFVEYDFLVSGSAEEFESIPGRCNLSMVSKQLF